MNYKIYVTETGFKIPVIEDELGLIEKVPEIINLPQGHSHFPLELERTFVQFKKDNNRLRPPIISERLILEEPTDNFKQEDLGKIIDIYYI